MKFRNVERLEVVVGRFDLRAFDDGKADGKENVLDLLKHLAYQVVCADGADYAGEQKIFELIDL